MKAEPFSPIGRCVVRQDVTPSETPVFNRSHRSHHSHRPPGQRPAEHPCETAPFGQMREGIRRTTLRRPRGAFACRVLLTWYGIALLALGSFRAAAAPGDLDGTFTVLPNAAVTTMAVQPDGKMVIG